VEAAAGVFSEGPLRLKRAFFFFGARKGWSSRPGCRGDARGAPGRAEREARNGGRAASRSGLLGRAQTVLALALGGGSCEVRGRWWAGTGARRQGAAELRAAQGPSLGPPRAGRVDVDSGRSAGARAPRGGEQRGGGDRSRGWGARREWMDARGGGIGRGEDRERRGTAAGRPVGRASWAVLKQSSRWRWAGDPARCGGGGGRGPVLGARALRNCARPRGPPSGRPGVALRARLAADRFRRGRRVAGRG
jgi:hypothetical protein